MLMTRTTVRKMGQEWFSFRVLMGEEENRKLALILLAEKCVINVFFFYLLFNWCSRN